MREAFVLAAADGSVNQATGTIGAGYVFCCNHDGLHQGAKSVSVGGELASLPVQLAATHLLLENVDKDS
eukprot:82969-Rhodomonas_salina.1